MAIITKFYKTRSDGVRLYESLADNNVYTPEAYREHWKVVEV